MHCRAFLRCFCCLHLCPLNQWELVSPDFSVSRVWISLSSAFSFTSPAALVWMPESHHCWPSNHPCMAQSLPMGRHLQAAMYFCRSGSGAQLPLTLCCLQPVLLVVALCSALGVWVAGQAGGIRRWLELRVCACMVALRVHGIRGMLHQLDVGDGGRSSASVQGLKCWLSCLWRSAEKDAGEGKMPGS